MGVPPLKPMTVAAAPSPKTAVGDEDEGLAITGDFPCLPQDEVPSTKGDKNATPGADRAENSRGGNEQRVSIDHRPVENQVQEALENLEFHLGVLQRSVDDAHINMRIASQEFSALLKKV